MRGPGPKWHAKHDPAPAAIDSMPTLIGLQRRRLTLPTRASIGYVESQGLDAPDLFWSARGLVGTFSGADWIGSRLRPHTSVRAIGLIGPFPLLSCLLWPTRKFAMPAIAARSSTTIRTSLVKRRRLVAVTGDLDIKVFSEHLGGADNVVEALQGFDIICAMRERTPFPRAVIEKLPDLKLLITTGLRNASIDVAAAKERGIVVCGTPSASAIRPPASPSA